MLINPATTKNQKHPMPSQPTATSRHCILTIITMVTLVSAVSLVT